MKKIVKLLMFIVLFSCFGKTVKAINKVSLSSPTMEVENGKNITILIDFDLDKNNYVSSAILSYDKNIFETINQSNFILDNDSTFSDVLYNDTNKMFVLTNNSGKEIKEQLKIKLKVKSNALSSKTTISLNSIKLSDGNTLDKLNDEKIEITIQNKNDKTTKENKTVNNTKVETKKVSRHGSFKIIVLVFLAILCVIGMAIYNVIYDNIPGYSALSNKMVINTLLFIGTVICAFLAVYFKNNRGDVNNDTKTDYNDTLSIINYVLDIKNEDINEESNQIDEEVASNMDINHDGEVTIKDVALTIKKTKKNNYTVSLSDVKVSNYSLNKNENFKISFKANVKPYTLVKYVYIDNKKYNVTKVDKNEYSVLINGLSKTGLHTLNIDKVILDNNKSYQVNSKVKVDILKDKPILTDKKIIQNGKEVSISFNINDIENTIKNSYLIILNNDKEVFKSMVNKGFNSFKITLEEGQCYFIKVLVDYDLDSDNKVIDYQNINLLDEKLNILKQNKLEVSDIFIPDLVSDKLVITFKANLEILKVIIDGITYPVKKENDLYKVEIDNLKLGSQKLKIEKFILKDEEVDFNQEYEYIVLKNKPVIEITSTKEDLINNTLTVDFNFLDKDNTVSSIKANLKDEKNDIIDSQNIDLKANEIVFKTKESSIYKIEFIVTYSLDDNKNIEEVLATKEVKTTKEEPLKPLEDEQKEKQNTLNDEENQEDNEPKEEVLVNQMTEDEKRKRLTTL